MNFSVSGIALAATIAVSSSALAEGGIREDWVKCQRYDNSPEHVAQCLGSFPEEVNATGGECLKVRSLYEDKLIAGNGEEPEGYKPARCSTVQDAMELFQR